MNKIILFGSFIASSICVFAQSFPPAAGQVGSTAISKDSSVFVDWASTCEVVRGYLNIEDPTLGFASFGETSFATGPATGISTDAVSLGDGGTATVTFNGTITNGEGPDFAVFENGVTDNFLELGFVEVSSDGVRFVRFPAVSEIAPSPQIGGFGSIDPTYIHNFAGKYRAGFGTPFDLDDLIDSTGIDLNAITHVRIVDVIGSIDPQHATYDSKGNIINNLHPTPFESGGFDLEAVGVINSGTLSINKVAMNNMKIYPNPAVNELHIENAGKGKFSISNILGVEVFRGAFSDIKTTISVKDFENGLYLITSEDGSVTSFLIKK